MMPMRDCHKIEYGLDGNDGIMETGETNTMTGADFGCIHWEADKIETIII